VGEAKMVQRNRKKNTHASTKNRSRLMQDRPLVSPFSSSSFGSG
jgi:hypothetical protein